jgi:hypothetical protein
MILLQCITVIMLWIHGGGKAALLPTKPAASGAAFASPQGGRKKMRLPCYRDTLID